MDNCSCISWKLTNVRYGYAAPFIGISFKPVVCLCKRCSAEFEKNNTSFELEYIWEHEFLDIGRVIGTVKTWLNLNQPEAIYAY